MLNVKCRRSTWNIASSIPPEAVRLRHSVPVLHSCSHERGSRGSPETKSASTRPSETWHPRECRRNAPVVLWSSHA